MSEADAAQIGAGQTRTLGPYDCVGYASLTGSIISDQPLTVTISQGPVDDADGPWPKQTLLETSGDDSDGAAGELDIYTGRHRWAYLTLHNGSGSPTTTFRCDLQLTTAEGPRKRIELARKTSQVTNGGTGVIFEGLVADFDALSILLRADKTLTLNVYHGDEADLAAGVWPYPSTFTATTAGGGNGQGQAFEVDLVGTAAKVELVNSAGTDTTICVCSVFGRPI